MRGWIFRRAVSIKEFGERLAHIEVFGKRPLFWASGIVITLGLALRDSVLNNPIH